jgi:ribose transport system ATP-binding protein
MMDQGGRMNSPAASHGVSPALEFKSVSKSYGSTKASRSVSFDVMAGEVVALVGKNGAGKSTLMNLLSGVIAPDEGEICLLGHPVHLNSPTVAQANGVATVFQELSLSPNLSVMENIFAGRAPRRFGFVDWRKMKAEAKALLDRFGLSIDPEIRIGDLPMSSRQMVEIAKAVSLGAQVLLLDEPTSALNADEKQALFSVIATLKQAGTAIVYISHHLDEVIALSDRIVVLRDGAVVSIVETEGMTAERLVRDMVGREIEEANDSHPATDVAVLSVENVSRLTVKDASLVVRAGEIVSIAGLMGAGRSELAHMIVGLARPHSGKVTVNGKPVDGAGMNVSVRQGIAYVPAERKTEGLFLDLPVASNIAVTTLSKNSRVGFMQEDRIRNLARRHVERLSIRLSSTQAPVRSLSGGNQQKVLLAKWLEIAPKLLVVEEPTKGVDIGAKYDIHREIKMLAANGAAVLVVSSDLPEILSLSHRVLVMHNGRLVADIDARHATEQEIVAHASGLEEPAHVAV